MLAAGHPDVEAYIWPGVSLMSLPYCFTSAKAPFSSNQKPKIFAQYPSHRILRHMYGVLNVDEKKLITQLAEKS